MFDTCLILHGCPQSADNVIPKSQRWMNWLEEKLRERGSQAFALDMPVPWQPRYEDWKNTFEKFPVTKESVLVGHSCGAAFLVRWLLESKQVVKKLILVAPAYIPETQGDHRRDLYNFDLPVVCKVVANDTVIFISNDHERHLRSAKLYQKALGARLRELPDKGHFLIFTMGTREFPELLEEVLS